MYFISEPGDLSVMMGMITKALLNLRSGFLVEEKPTIGAAAVPQYIVLSHDGRLNVTHQDPSQPNRIPRVGLVQISLLDGKPYLTAYECCNEESPGFQQIKNLLSSAWHQFHVCNYAAWVEIAVGKLNSDHTHLDRVPILILDNEPDEGRHTRFTQGLMDYFGDRYRGMSYFDKIIPLDQK